MTPEERFIRIENALGAMAERQVAHDMQLETIETQIEKNTAGIRELITVSRTLVDHEQVIDGKLNALIDTVERMGIKVDKLTDTVDRMATNIDMLATKIDTLSDSLQAFLKGWQKPNGQN